MNGSGAPLVPGSEILGRRKGLDRGLAVKLYDFLRPDKFSREQITTVQKIHETFARFAETKLSSMLREQWDFRVASVDQLNYGEFLESVATPSVFGIFSMAPLKGPALVEIDPAVAAALIERLFGGKGMGAAPLGRELTDLEFCAMEKPMTWLLEALAASWATLCGLRPALSQIETNARFCQIVPPTDMILIVTFEVGIGGSEGGGPAAGLVNLVVPALTIEPLLPRLSARYWFWKRPSAEEEAKSPRPAGLDLLALPAEAYVEGPRLSMAELAALRPGSTLGPLDLEGGVRLRLGGETVYALAPRESARDGRLLFAPLASPRPNKPDDGAARLEAVAAGLEEGIAAMRDSVERGLAALGAELESLKGRQEAVEDRVAFGGEGAVEAGGRPFAGLAGASESALAAFLAEETPQLTALVLSQLEESLAARVLDALPEGKQVEVALRIGSMDRILPEILGAVDRVLCRKIGSIEKEGPAPGGVVRLVELLNLSPRATEKHVVESLERIDPAMAEQVKRSMFVFEDISLLDDASLRAVAAEADRRDLLVAMKPVSDALRERIFARFGDEEARSLRQEYERLGKVRLSESDAAGMRIVAIVRRLESEGRIFIEGPSG